MRLIDANALQAEYKERHNGKRLLLIDVAPTIEPEPRWIPCSERLPEDGKFVLVCNDDRKMMIAKYESEILGWEYKYTSYDWDVWDEQEQGKVMAWMPLPEPYEERRT